MKYVLHLFLCLLYNPITQQEFHALVVAFMLFYICSIRKGSIIIDGLIRLFSACTNN
jgi:hypothetical protein